MSPILLNMVPGWVYSSYHGARVGTVYIQGILPPSSRVHSAHHLVLLSDQRVCCTAALL